MSRGRKPIPKPVTNAAAPAPPDSLSPAARAEWQRVAALLADTLLPADVDALTIYAESYAVYRLCQDNIDSEGAVVEGSTGAPITNPYCVVQKQAWERIRVLLPELGLSPSGRARRGVKPAEPSKPRLVGVN